MRILLLLFVGVVILGTADIFFFKSQYRNDIWRDIEIEAQKINYEVRRAVRF